MPFETPARAPVGDSRGSENENVQAEVVQEERGFSEMEVELGKMEART